MHWLLEEMDSYKADGVDFVPIFGSGEVYATYTRGEVLDGLDAHTLAIPKSARRYWTGTKENKHFCDPTSGGGVYEINERNRYGTISYTMNFPVVPVERPNVNGVVYTKEAVLDALKLTPEELPIMDYSDRDGAGRIIGVTTSRPHDIVFDEDSYGFRFTIDGMLFHAGTCENINSRRADGEINGLTITSIGITE